MEQVAAERVRLDLETRAFLTEQLAHHLLDGSLGSHSSMLLDVLVVLALIAIFRLEVDVALLVPVLVLASQAIYSLSCMHVHDG